MWKIQKERDGQVSLSDTSNNSKWVRYEDAEKVMKYPSWEHYFMSLDMRPPDMWIGLDLR